VAQSVFVDRPRPHRLDVVLRGDIDSASTPQLDRAVFQIVTAAPEEIQLDLSDVTFFSAAGVTFLIRLRAAAAAQGAELVIGPVPHCVLRVLELAGEPTLLSNHITPLAG
jgi:anti-anti-sigma factor